MSKTILEGLREKRAVLESEIDALVGAEDFNPADETFTRAKADAEALDAKIRALVENEGRRAAANEIDAISIRTKKAAEVARVSVNETMSIGEAYVRSAAYTDYVASPRGTSGRVNVDFESTLFRAPILSSGINLTIKDRIADARLAEPLLPLLDAVPRIPVSGNSVEWVKYPVAPEAGNVAEGAAKPEMAIAPTLTTVSLDIVAHWVQYTRNVLEDDAALMAYINSSLRTGVLKKIANNIATVLNAETGFLAVTKGATLLASIRKAIGAVQTAGYDPSVVIMNPADYADIDVNLLGQTVINTGSGPQVASTYWGVRPIPAAAVPVGTLYVGDIGTAMALLTRSDVAVYTTDSHASTFTSNVLTTLAETRAKAIVHQPGAMAKVNQAVVVAEDDAPVGKK